MTYNEAKRGYNYWGMRMADALIGTPESDEACKNFEYYRKLLEQYEEQSTVRDIHRAIIW